MSTSAIAEADRLWLKRLIANAPGVSLAERIGDAIRALKEADHG